MKKSGIINITTLLAAGIFMVFCLVNIAGAAVMPAFTRLGPVTVGISAPTAVAVDNNGRVLVAESINNRLLAYSASGSYLSELSGLNKPISVAVDDDLRIYIGNKDSGNVEVYDSAFNFLFKLGAGDGEFVQPSSITLDSTGKVYVADSGQNMIKVYNPDGSYNFSFGSYGSGDGQFNFPTSIAIDATAGEIIVSDLHLTTDQYGSVVEGAKIQVFDMNGVFKRGFGEYGVGSGLMAKPIGVTVDKVSRIYVTDSQMHVVHVFDSNGVSLGTLFDETVPMRTPLGITISSSNKLYVASLNTARVEVFGIDSYTDMTVAPLALSFEGNIAAAPAMKNVEVTNNGTQNLNWTATTDKDWITISQASGSLDISSAVVLNVGVDITGLSAGLHTGCISVIAGSGDTETVNVELTVLPTPVLSVAPAVLEFTSVNGASPASQGFSITNTGEGTLEWSAVSNNAWISIDKTTGTAGGTINVSVDPSSKAFGAYSGTITVTSGNALSSPATITVLMNLIEETGGINVVSNIEQASFTISGPEYFSGIGKNWSVEDALSGTYTIIFGSVDGYNTPFSLSKVLTANGTINFTGVYTRIDAPQIKRHIIAGAGPEGNNSGLVNVLDSEGKGTGVNFLAHGYGYGVNVAAGDINCDEVDEIITAPGPGPDNPAEVRIYDNYGSELTGLAFNAFDYFYGVSVASGDFNGDGFHEVVAGAGAGPENPALVKVVV